MPAGQEKQSAGSPEELYKKGLIALEGGQYDYAVSLFRDALNIEPGFTKANEGIRTAKTRKLQGANPLIQKIRKSLYTLQGALYKKRKKYDAALDKYESLFAMPDPSYRLLPPLADLYHEKGMTDRASAAYKSFLQRDPDNIHCLLKLGKIYIEQGNIAEAKKIYDHLAASSSADDAVMKEVKDAYALLTIDRGRWDEDASFRRKVDRAEDAGEKEQSPDKISPEIKSRLGDKVIALKKQTEKEPENLSIQKELADSLRELRRFDEAIPVYNKLLRKDPDNMDILRSIGNIYIKSGEYEKAVKILEHLHNLLPENTNVLKLLADIYIKQDASLKAIEAYLKLCGLKPDDPEFHESLGKLYEQNRYFEEAVAQYDRVIELKPERGGLHENIGNLYLRDSKQDKAIERYEKAASASPENTSLKKTLAELYLNEKRVEDAERTLRELLRQDPDDSRTKAKLEETALSVKEKKLAETDSRIKELETAVETQPENRGLKKELEDEKKKRAGIRVEILIHKLKNQPENPALRFELGKAFKEEGDIDSAIKEFQQAAKSPEKSVESLHMLGLCFEGKNILDIASRQLEKAESKVDEGTDLKKSVLYDLGRVYEKMGEKDRAVEKYKEIYEVDISYKDVAKKIEEAYG